MDVNRPNCPIPKSLTPTSHAGRFGPVYLYFTTACVPIGPSGIAYRTEVFENTSVKGSEFLRKVKAIARRNKLTYRWVPERGSGSHGTVYVGARFTVVKDLKKELGPGLLSDMLRQIGIRKEDL